MGELIAGCSPLVRELAQKLAPGRKVQSITLHFDARSVAVATVSVLIEDDDVPFIERAASEVGEPKIVEVPKPHGRHGLVGEPYARG